MDSYFTRTTLIAALLLIAIYKLVAKRRRVPKAPGIGYGSIPILGPWRGWITFLKDPKGTIERGCRENPTGYFRLACHASEYLVVVGEKQIAEFSSIPDEVLSFPEELKESLQMEWSLGYGVAHRPYQVCVSLYI